MNILEKNIVLLIDTNILLDALQKREPFYKNAAEILRKCERKQVVGCISSLTFANAVYIMRKELTPEIIESTAYKLSRILVFIDLNHWDINKAAKMRWKDFEDALQSAAAERVKADYIVTRNVKDFEQSNIKALSPEDFLI